MSSRWPDWLPLRKALQSREPYGAPQVEARARLNTNENPNPLPLEVIQGIESAISKVLGDLNRYPDRDAKELRRRLASYVNDHVAPAGSVSFTDANIWPANGSNEVLQSILLAFGEDIAGFAPSYSMHTILAEAVGRSFKAVPLRSDFTPDMELVRGYLAARKPSIFFVTTPNNPTGRSLSLDEIASLAEMMRNHSGLLVVDEAYGEFSDQVSAVTLIERHPHLVVVRTMSKAFAFAGARIGYAIADSHVIEALQLVRLPYHLSSLTQAAGIAAIDHCETLLAEVERLKSAREELRKGIEELGLRTVPSDANFILFGGFDALPSLKEVTSGEIWSGLLGQGVLIRDVGIPGYLRVTVGTEKENALFLESLTRVVRA